LQPRNDNMTDKRTQWMGRGVVMLALALAPTVSQALPITLYVAPDNTYQNTTNSPCVFYGPGNCSGDPADWPEPVGNTGGGNAFTPNPLTQSYSGGELIPFAQYVGRDFLLGLDINDNSTPQTLSTLTVNFYNSASLNIGSYTFGPTITVPSVSNGVGYADYVLAAGCLGVQAGSGNTATCTNYSPFVAPAGTRQIDFSFGLTGANAGADKLFLISAGPGGVPTPFDVDPTAVPEPASLLLLGTGLFWTVRVMRRR